jgi:hypothetical protein
MRNRPILLVLVLIMALTLLLVGCANALTPPSDTESTEQIPPPVPSATEVAPVLPEREPSETPERLELRPSQTTPGVLDRIETPEISPLVGEVPAEILEEIIADLVQRTGAAREDIQVVKAEAVVWNDGSLGCHKPGEFYIQILVNGYWVVLQVEGVYYDYRVSDSGHFILCEGKGMPPNPSPDTGGQDKNPLVSQAKEDLAKRLGIQIDEIELLKIEEVTWRDSSLGCPQPGMAYAQVLVNGSLIQLKHEDTVYKYHSGKGGRPFLCENPTPGFEGGKNTDEGLVTPPILSDK